MRPILNVVSGTEEPVKKPRPIPIRYEHLARAKQRIARKQDDERRDAFQPAVPAPGVLPPPGAGHNGGPQLAMDDQIIEVSAWAAGAAISSSYNEGTIFLGYATLSILAQRAEYRVIFETIAEDMTREWITIKTTSSDDKSEKVKKLDELQREKYHLSRSLP